MLVQFPMPHLFFRLLKDVFFFGNSTFRFALRLRSSSALSVVAKPKSVFFSFPPQTATFTLRNNRDPQSL